MKLLNTIKFRLYCWIFDICPIHVESIMKVWERRSPTSWKKITIGCISCNSIARQFKTKRPDIDHLAEAKELKDKI